MIFFAGNDGTIIKTLPTPVYQGAANANTIYLFAPFANNLEATVAFRLPNGVTTEPSSMTYRGDITELVDGDGTAYSGWVYDMPNSLTAYYGTLGVQFFFYNAQGKITATSLTSITIGRGVTVALPTTPSADVYQQILTKVTQIQQALSYGQFTSRSFFPWNSNYSYGANEITYYPQKGNFGTLIRSVINGNNNHPPYVNGEIDARYWQVVADFNVLQEIEEAQEEVFEAAEQAAKDAATSQNSAQSAQSFAQSAEDSKNAAKQSEQMAEKYAQSLGDLQDEVNGIVSGETAVPKAVADANGDNIANNIASIKEKIPPGASATNQLADQAFVNSTVNNMAAFYITSNAEGAAFSSHAALMGATTFYSGGKVRVPTQNDYAVVLADETQPIGPDNKYPTTRYSYQGGTYPNGQWDFQYVVNNTSLTQAQVDALNSGITAQGLANIVDGLNGKLSKSGGTMTGNLVLSTGALAVGYLLVPGYGSGTLQSKGSGFYADVFSQYSKYISCGTGDRFAIGYEYVGTVPGVHIKVYNSEQLELDLRLTDGGGNLLDKNVRVYSTRNKPTAADVGALPIGGGTLTGPLNGTNISASQRITGNQVYEGNVRVYSPNNPPPASGNAATFFTYLSVEQYSENGTDYEDAAVIDPTSASDVGFHVSILANQEDGFGFTDVPLNAGESLTGRLRISYKDNPNAFPSDIPTDNSDFLGSSLYLSLYLQIGNLLIKKFHLIYDTPTIDKLSALFNAITETYADDNAAYFTQLYHLLSGETYATLQGLF